MSNILIVGADQGIGYYMVIRLLEKGNKELLDQMQQMKNLCRKAFKKPPKNLEIYHLMHPPLTNTASSPGLPVSKEFMVDAEKVEKDTESKKLKTIGDRRIPGIGYITWNIENQ